MSHEQAWTLEEMARIVQAERLAAAAKYRREAAVRGTTTSTRTVLANALRWLAGLVDEKPDPRPKPERRLVRAY
jgi:hypothetical protein